MSAFAAGCAKCGADLEAHARRARLATATVHTDPRRRLPRPSLPRPEISIPEAAFLAATVFCAFFVSVLGLVLALLGVMHGVFEDRRGVIAVFAVLALVAAGLEIRALV